MATNRLLAAALELQEFCIGRAWRFCFIGGLAVQHWGEARVTRDADLELFTGIGDESSYAQALLDRFASRLSDAREFALRHRVLLLRASNQIPLDISFGALDFEDKAVTAATDEEVVAGVRLRLCQPNALIIFKAFAGRAQDWLDIEGIVTKSAARLSWHEIRTDLTPLMELKDDTATIPRRETIIQRGAGSAEGIAMY